ncbi:3-oxoacyl-[acyl-carrier-protein] synthase, mitochondrial-like [Hibiscus syriacus]|uniref:3-oxoacyl-[acyl-carrier-protein] synthase, mitochondrial-like n=1 Tax=Hibiscus syriacus TaxID=106335 RepID=UPI00192337B8|nr:3-oxoacyl-[acyl-carrier-protein] synthase, mitochondrial-like [Hibiscus syriacus]
MGCVSEIWLVNCSKLIACTTISFMLLSNLSYFSSIGEGSGVLILEDLEHAKRREAKFYVEVRGYGMSSHAHHITQPHIDGRGAIFGHGTCLETIWSHPNQVDYVNAQLRLHLWVMQLKQMQSNPYSLTMQHLVLWSSPQQRGLHL